jgi:hypothetical protein
MGKRRNLKTAKNVVRAYGASFKLIEKGKYYETGKTDQTENRKTQERPTHTRKGINMLVQRKLNSSSPEGIARSGAPKNLKTPQPVVGHKRQTTGDLAPYHHGISVDEPRRDKLN